MATVHKIDVKQIKEAFEELKDVREDLSCAKSLMDIPEINRLKRKERRLRKLLFSNSQTYANLG